MKLLYTPNINHLMPSAATQVIYNLTTVKKKKITSEPLVFSPQDGALLRTTIHTMHNNLKGNL